MEKRYPTVTVLIPARNEEKNIGECLESVFCQSYMPQQVIVINDASTDNTEKIVERLISKYLCLELINNIDKPLLKGRALNLGLAKLKEDTDIVISVDADTLIHNDCVEQIVISFIKDKKLGGVCSIAGLREPNIMQIKYPKKMLAWVLWKLQKIEYAGFDAERTATHNNVMILHGLCSGFRTKAIKIVGGYSENHLIEDYDLTLRIKLAGWKAEFNPKIKAFTNVPLTIKALLRQRLRWMRGGVDIILQYGINKFTIVDFLNHVLYLMLLIGIILMVASGIQGGWKIRLNPHPIPITLAVVGYLTSVYKLKFVRNLKLSDIIIRLLIIPELLCSIIYSFLQAYAYVLSLVKTPKKW